MKKMFLLCGALLALPTYAQAQTIDLPYESVLKTYQPHSPVQIRDWKASNEAVRAAGGWRTYLRDSQTPDAADAPPTAPKQLPQAPSKPAHEGHKP